MLIHDIRAEFGRLQIHPANLDVSSTNDSVLSLKGSLLAFWNVPATIDGQWLLGVLRGLPDSVGPKGAMDAISAAASAIGAAGSEATVPQTGPGKTNISN